VDRSSADSLEVPFVFTISYNPSVAQISVKGKANIIGEQETLDQIYSGYKEKKTPPPVIVQTVSNVVFLESVILSKSLNIPPPLPLPKIPVTGAKKREAEPSYRA
jgi:hypothetical protein